MTNFQVIPYIICKQELFFLCGVFHALNNTQLTIISHSSIFSKNNISNVQLIFVERVVHKCTFFNLAKYWNLSQGRFLLQWALIFMHDNAHPHTAGVSMDCLGEEGIDAIDWPACSPDLNPIEYCWNMVDRRVRGRGHPPRTVRGPRTTLVDEWANIPQMPLID